MKIISIKIQDATNNHLEGLARKMSTNKSEIIRKAIQEYLSRISSEVNKGTFMDQAVDLAGSLEGSSDLSTGDSHLEDYGR